MTPGPWHYEVVGIGDDHANPTDVCEITNGYARIAEHVSSEDAALISAVPELWAEMLRFLPVLERAEADAELWDRLTAGLGIATLNAYRAAIAKAEGK